MARYPGGRWAPLPENATQAAIRPTQIILHTAVDSPGPTRLEAYFAREDVHVESHFWITLAGEVVQMMDTEVRADANRTANRRSDGTGAISIETEDEGNPAGVPWSDAQLRAIDQVCRWASSVHGIPLRKCEGPDDPGVGYHAMWGAPSAWTPTAGKTCPGPLRISQFEDVLLPLWEVPEMAGMNETSAKRLASALYWVFLKRDPGKDAVGHAYWTKVAMEQGGPEALVLFLMAAQGEIQTRDAKAAAAGSVVNKQELLQDVMDEFIARLS